MRIHVETHTTALDTESLLDMNNRAIRSIECGSVFKRGELQGIPVNGEPDVHFRVRY
jgi:hypothetical protein